MIHYLEDVTNPLGSKKMGKLPKTILSDIRTKNYPSKEFSYADFKKAFASNSYGPTATGKWFQYFLDNEIIIEVEPRTDRYTCTLW